MVSEQLAMAVYRSFRVLSVSSYFRRYATANNKQDKTSAPVLVAIDIAKLNNEVLIEGPGQARRQQLEVLKTDTEHG